MWLIAPPGVNGRRSPSVTRGIAGRAQGASPLPFSAGAHLRQGSWSQEPGPRPRPAPRSTAGPPRDQRARIWGIRLFYALLRAEIESIKGKKSGVTMKKRQVSYTIAVLYLEQ
ncbi:hypothetical protein NDU88_001536 [Pleurodeles waltl]|uniref:Uncharacterized protein n=1 Tax=Pleurodeles waltl TaxID=8319 RepID=A0AAV7UAG7_PLEWA|nr:hypothetical protein NDU88_001536 [Pleurodeles waltl]